MPDYSQMLGSLLRTDPMSAQSHQAYQDAVGAPLVPPQAQSQPMSPQGVQPVPPNIQGLAKLLIQTGRAQDPITAMRMAQQMTLGR